MYLTASPYVDTQTFTFAQLTSGNYTIQAEIVRPDDENLINNMYSRTVVIPFAPMTVYYNGTLSPTLRDQISSTYAQQGVAIEFVDRSVNNVSFDGEKVLWIGDLDKATAQMAREDAMNGGDFNVLPNGNISVNPLNDLFVQVASPKELDAMNRVLVAPADVELPNTANSHIVQTYADANNTLMSFGKNEIDRDRVATRHRRQLFAPRRRLPLPDRLVPTHR